MNGIRSKTFQNVASAYIIRNVPEMENILIYYIVKEKKVLDHSILSSSLLISHEIDLQ